MKTVVGIAAVASMTGCAAHPRIMPAVTSVETAQSGITIPLRKYQGQLRFIRLEAGGDSADFLFDTGGGWTLISPRLAERTRCNPSGRIVGYRMTGERLDVPVCGSPVSLGLGDWRADSIGVGEFDLMKLLPAGWPRLDGVLSLKSFSGRAVTLDLARDQLIVETPSSLVQRTRKMTELRSRLATGDDGSALVAFLAVRMRDRDLWFEFDSGNLDVVLIAPHVAKLAGITRSEQPSPASFELAPGHAFTVGARERELIYDGVLNASLIATRIFTLDLASGRAWIGFVE